MTKSLQKQASSAHISSIGIKALSQPKRRDYISWSAMSLLEKDEDAYVRRYLYGEEGFRNDAMDFGKVVADALQDEKSVDPHIRYIITFIPRFEVPEQEIVAKYKKMKLLGRMDSSDLSLSSFREYKTGRTKWTQTKVDSHGQLVFYATIIFLIKKRIPHAFLDWIPTEYDEDGFLKLTGDIKTFKRKAITLTDISQMLGRIKKASDRIDKLWKKLK